MIVFRRNALLVGSEELILKWLICVNSRSLDLLEHLVSGLWIVRNLASFLIWDLIFGEMANFKRVLGKVKRSVVIKKGVISLVRGGVTLIGEGMLKVGWIRVVWEAGPWAVLDSRFQIYCYVLFFLSSYFRAQPLGFFMIHYLEKFQVLSCILAHCLRVLVLVFAFALHYDFGFYFVLSVDQKYWRTT